MSDLVHLTAEPINTADYLSAVLAPAAGGVCVFLGTTRAETSGEGRPLAALDYEAYAEMAQSQLQELAARARARWPVTHLALVHRVGRVPLGEPSVLVAVSTPHRGEAFECCRWLIDTLKAELAVWKKEIWTAGDPTWARANKEWSGAPDER